MRFFSGNGANMNKQEMDKQFEEAIAEKWYNASRAAEIARTNENSGMPLSMAR